MLTGQALTFAATPDKRGYRLLTRYQFPAQLFSISVMLHPATL
jgi:hypothetical protein